MSLDSFHPAVRSWFEGAFAAPSEPQRAAFPAIARGESTLIAAPTGSGKTLAAFLVAIDDLVRRALDGTLEDAVQVLYVSPLRALSHDIHTNLEVPLEGIAAKLRAMGIAPPSIRSAVRTGDTPARERTAMTKKPPHIFVTTPESLYVLLTSEGGRRMLRQVRSVIVDEIHAVVDDRRGAHLALSLERLERLVGRPIPRVGLSATQTPIEEVARFLVGSRNVDANGNPRCTIVDVGHHRARDLAIEMPRSPLDAVMANEVWEELHDRIAELVRAHRTTLVFVNTRRTAERLSARLADRLGETAVTSHHGSLSREHRLSAERRLKEGSLRAVVATASLELGIDVGDVDLVVQIGSPGSIATFLQRVGRAGHSLSGTPKGRVFPTSRDDLVECIALLDSVSRGELDPIAVPVGGLDVLAQQLVATVAAEGEESLSLDELFALARGAHPYRALEREQFDAVVAMLAEGFATGRGRRGALVHLDAVNGRVRARKSARLTALTNGGAIPDNFEYEVRLEPEGHRVGTLHEDFAIESMAGDIFQLGNASYRITKIETGIVRVADARGAPPSIPFWIAEAPSRSELLSHAVCRVRELVEESAAADSDPAIALQRIAGVVELAAREASDHLLAAYRSLGVMPTESNLVLERFFDEAGGMHLVAHSPRGSRLNRAFGLALRKRFCRSFNVELQAAANEDSFVLSLGPMHAMDLPEVFTYLRSNTAEDVLTQALLDSPMWGTRWRWNTTRALAVPRMRGGKKMPPAIQRIIADDLLAVSFPDQVACAENLSGPRQIPEHPLVQQTLDDCLHEAMDVDALVALLAGIESGAIRCIAKDTTEPSPLSASILNARPYAFLDDAPLEERRTQAVAQRRFHDAATTNELAALDPAAIERVREECAPLVRSPDELHDALLIAGAMRVEEASAFQAHLDVLVRARRATTVHTAHRTFVVAAERLATFLSAHPGARMAPAIRAYDTPTGREAAVVELVRGRLDRVGPATVHALADALDLHEADVEAAVATLTSAGIVLRGRYTPSCDTLEYCERGLLARIHRQTIDRLRKAIEPVSAGAFMRFLTLHHGIDPERRKRGVEGLASVLDLLEGFEAPAVSWEQDLLATRMASYEPSDLDLLCLSGRFTWMRRTTPASSRAGATPVKSMPTCIVPRVAIDAWRGRIEATELRAEAVEVLAALQSSGAAFSHDLARATRLLPAQVDAALAELAHRGLVHADSFAGLRAFLVPAHKRPREMGARRSAIASAGRWTTLPTEGALDAETAVRALLRRYGVVFRRVLDREDGLPPWRDMLHVLRHLEAKGEVRGGRFVAGFSGEQYALPEVVSGLRAAREPEPRGVLVSVASADPLNLIGILTPHERLAANANHRLLFRDGNPVAVLEGKTTRALDAGSLDAEDARALERRPDTAARNPALSGPRLRGLGHAPSPR